MSEQNHLDIGKALNHILRPTLAGFVGQKLSKHFGSDWWRRGVLDVLYDTQKKYLPDAGSYEKLTDSLDVQLSSILIDIHWNEIFYKCLPRIFFNYFKELQTIRNVWAHEPMHFDDKNTERALDTMILIAEALDDETATKLREILSERNGQPRLDEPQDILPQENFSLPTNLKPWRNVIEPRDEVAQGRFTQSEFAADLGQVVRGESNNVEYTDADEFFVRTYLTSGLKRLLVTTLKRLTGDGGDPIIQLKTSFGGGKTHSLLALYHLFGGKLRSVQTPIFREIFKSANVTTLPKVHTAVIVGTWENSLKSTLWGEIAKQLATSTGKPELYEMIRENDEHKIAPGVALLTKLFNEAGACLILIDELVAYGRTLSEGKISAGGNFENLLSFIQQLTEAAKASPKTSLVVSIPESDSEVGGDLGWRVLRQVEKLFGRVEFVWSPISTSEGYEIVRRRLFKPCRNESAREKVCAAFFGMYVNNAQDFPSDSRQAAYKDKLLACYPIHPQLFDFLYERWTSLENFQKTRGVLRLMAQVIHSLWSNNDMNALIMPGTIPLGDADVRDELTTKLLKGNWDAIVQSEVDGKNSKPYLTDKDNNRFMRFSAARKISRTIFMGTAAGSGKSGNGVEENEIHLGAIQPQEFESVAVFNDALTKIKSSLYYLYSQDTRCWFGVNPTLRKMVDDKREKYSDEDIFDEIESRIKNWRVRSDEFKAVYRCPKSSGDVPDEQTGRLVILSPKYAFGSEKNSATEAARNFLNMRGTIPRQWQNMLLFLVADAEKLRFLQDTVREFKAWREVYDEARRVNLDLLQLEDAKNNRDSAEKIFVAKITQTYCRLIYPDTYGTADINLPLAVDEINCQTDEENISAAYAYFVEKELLVGKLGVEKLKSLLEQFGWKESDCINVNRFWGYFAQFYYMPRLVDKNVLFDAIRRAVNSEALALADDKEFSNLQFGEVNASVTDEKFLVKASKAQELVAAEKKIVEPEPETITPAQIDEQPEESPPEVEALPTKFIMDTVLDDTRYVKHFNKCMSETAENLLNLPNVKMEIQIVVNVSVPDGIPKDIRETVEANCRDLRIRNFYFER